MPNQLQYNVMYTYEKFNIRLFPWFLLILGIIFTLSKMYIEAGISGSIGAISAISFSGFNIDAEKSLIRKYDRFLWFYIGGWREIPKPLYVTVVRIKLSGRRVSPLPLPMPESGKASRAYKLNLVVDGKERYISLTYGNRLAMLEEGMKIAKILNIRLLDHTTSEKQWLC
ncbi:MAG: hypothetical protein WD052_07155 [Bacteroidales bacterium]